MTAGERERIDRKYKELGKVARFIKYRISRKIGTALQDLIWDRWERIIG